MFAGDESGLSVVSVGTEAVFRNLNNFDALGYGLLSAPKISFENVTVRVKPDAGADKDFTGVTRPGEPFLVFQNQSGNRENSSYSIEDLLNAKTSKGIYVDTTDLEFSDTKSTITTYWDFQVNLGNKTFKLDGSTIDAANGTFYLTKSGNATMEVSGGAKITTSQFDLDNGAQINVAAGSSAVFGMTTPSNDAALTTGGTGFSIGKLDDPADGLISVAGDHKLDGGDYYFEADGEFSTEDSNNRNPLAGIKATGDIRGSAGTIYLRTANIDAGGNIELSDTDLTLATVNGKVPANNGNSSYEPWVFNKYWTALKADGDITIRNSNVITGSATGFRSYAGSILLDAGTTLTHHTHTDTDTGTVASGLFYAKNDIDILGQDSLINGRFHAISTDGNIKIFGRSIDIRPDKQVDNMELLDAKNGDVTLAAFSEDGVDQADANLIINYRDHQVSNSNVIAGVGKAVRLHGDTGVKLVTASIFFGSKGNISEEGFNGLDHARDTVTITAQKGTIDLQNGANVRTSVAGGGGYGLINIYGQTVTADDTDEGKLTESDFTDVAVKMAGSLHGTEINIGKGVGQSQITVSGKISAIDNTDADKGYSINLIAGSKGLELNNATVLYGDDQGGRAVLESRGGSIMLTGATVNDNGRTDIASTEENDTDAKAGNLEIKLTGTEAGLSVLAEDARSITLDSSTTVNDDIILIDAGEGRVVLNKSSSVIADTGVSNSLTVKGDSVSLAGGSHFGNDENGTSTGAKVTIETSDLALDNTSYITSEGAVSIKAAQGSNELTISMDQGGTSDDGAPSWIKGESVSIGSTTQTGATSVTGGQITSTGATASPENSNIVIAGGAGENGGVVINDSVVSAGITGSVSIEVGKDGAIQIGTEGADDAVYKDTQILGNNITIGSADGTGNGVDINDAQIGFPKDPEGSSAIGGSISINGGSGAVDIVASEIGVENNDSAHGALTSGFENVTITGDSVSIGSADKGSGAGTNTAIGGSNITIGDENTDSVEVGVAQIGTATEDDKAGSNVTINAGSDDALGSITIGSANSTGESVINGGNVTIGAGSSNAGITINGSRAEAEENASSTGITGDKVVIGNGKGDVSVTDSDIASTGTGDAGGITIEAGDEAELVIKDAFLDSTGGLAEGTDQFGTGNGTGNVTIIGGGSIAGSGIAAGGNVNFGGSTSDGNKDDHIVNVTGGSSISGNGMSVAGDTTVNLGGAEGTDKGNSVNIAGEGNVTVEGELNIAGDNDIKGEGDLTINTGTTGNGTVNVAEGGSITAGANDEGETSNTGNMTITGTGTVNVAGGKLEANGDGNGDGGNVNVTGADVNLSTGEDGTAGSIVADGFVTVGGEDSGQDLGGSINVDAGETGIIIAGGEDADGNNVVVGNGGQLNVANDGTPEGQGSLIISKDESVEKPDQGGLHIDTDTTVSVGEGGFVVSDNISFGTDNEGNTSGKLEVEAGGGIHTSADSILENTNKGDGAGLVIGNNSTVQVSGAVDVDKVGELDSILNDGKDDDNKVTIILDEISGVSEDTVISEDQLTADSTTADGYHGAVVGDAMIDVSGKGENDLSEGGGGSILVDYKENPNEGEPNGTLTVDGNVTITGSTTNPDREIVAGATDSNGDGKTDSAQTNGKFDIVLEDGGDLTLGKDGAAGGTLSGDITTSTTDETKDQQSNVTVNGGDFTVEGSIDLTHQNNGQSGQENTEDDGNIIIRDQNTKDPGNGNGLTVGGNVAAGNLEMTGDNTNFDVAGSVDLSGDATLTGGADADVVGSMDVGGDLDLSGTASLGKGEQTSQEAKPDLTVGGNLDITDSASIDRNDVDVNGNAHINGNGGLTADGNFDVAGELQIGTGTDIDGNETEAGNPTVSVSGGNLTTGTPGSSTAVDNGNLTIGQGTVNVTGKDGSGTKGNIIVGSTAEGGQTGNLVVGTVDGEGSATVEATNDITVSDGNATIHGNGQVTAGGSFDVNGSGDNGNATIEGSLTANDAEIDGNLTVGKVDGGNLKPNGSFVTEGSTDVGGNLIVNENGQLSVGSNPTGDYDGRLTVGGYVDTEAGSNVVANNGLTVGTADSEHFIGGSLTIGGTSEAGKPNAEFNGDLTVEAGGSLNNAAVVDGTTDTVVSGNLTVGSAAEGAQQATANLGDAEVTGTTTVNNGKVTSGDFTGKDDATISGAGTSFDATGDITLAVTNEDGSLTEGVEQPNLIIKDGASVSASAQEGGASSKGDVTVGGYAEVDGALKADGALTVSGANDGGNGLVIGNAANGGDWTAGDALQKDTTVDVGSLTVANDTVINGDGTLSSHGDSAFNGGLHVAAGGDYVNDNADSVTTVKDHLWLDAGSSIDTKGEFVLGATEGGQLLVGNTSDTAGGSTSSGVLNGTISAGSIDFGAYENTGNGNTITFAGDTTGEGDDATRFEAGFETSSLTGNVALSNGANGVLTPGDDGKAEVNGWLDVNAGEGDSLGSTLTTSAGNKTDYSTSSDKNAVLNMDSPISFGANSGLLLGDTKSEISDSPESGVYLGANSSLVINAGNMASGSVLFDNGTDNGMMIHVENVTSDNPIEISMNGWTMGTSGSLVFDLADLEDGVDVSDVIDFTGGSVLQNFQIVEEGGRDVIKMEATNVSEVTGGTLTGDLAEVVQNATNMGGNNYFHQAINQAFASPSATNPGQKIDLKTEDGQKALDAMVASGEISAETADAIKKAAANATEYSITRTEEGVHFVNAEGKNNFAMSADGIKTVEEIATFPIAAGAFNATFDYLTEFNRAVETRALEDRPEGRSQSVWAHVIATFNKSDELFGGSGYSADLYGGVLGTDVAIGGNTLVGGALTVGTGDIESRGAKIGNKNDATFYGLSLYAQHDIGAMSVKGDLTYLRTENKISGMYKGVDMGGEFDSDAISVGVRAEFKAYESDTFEVKPHLGIRYTNYSFDNYEGTDIDDINTIESPVGVAFSGKVKAEGGWTVVPELDLSVVPQLGDRKATVVNAGAGVDQTILEGAIFNAKLGLGLTKDNFSFGLNYQHGAGGFGRNNNAFQAHARWMF